MPENEFKEKAVGLFLDRSRPLRAYLAQVKYGEEANPNVALCMDSEHGEDDGLVDDIASLFCRMFGPNEHLDVLFLTESQEIQIRKVCCPFFSSRRFGHPDFYLVSGEGYGLGEVRMCYKGRRLMNGHPDGYMICEIEPPIEGQPYGLREKDMHAIVIASRHAGYSIFSIREWPVYVHVAQLADNFPDNKFVITEKEVVSIGWAEIYKSAAEAKASIAL